MKAKLTTQTWTEIVLSRAGGDTFGKIGFMEDDDKLLAVDIAGMDRDEALTVASVLEVWALTGKLEGDDLKAPEDEGAPDEEA